MRGKHSRQPDHRTVYQKGHLCLNKSSKVCNQRTTEKMVEDPVTARHHVLWLRNWTPGLWNLVSVFCNWIEGNIVFLFEHEQTKLTSWIAVKEVSASVFNLQLMCLNGQVFMLPFLWAFWGRVILTQTTKLKQSNVTHIFTCWSGSWRCAKSWFCSLTFLLMDSFMHRQSGCWSGGS